MKERYDMKKIMLGLLTVCAALMFHVSAFAYLSPTTATALITGIASLVVAGSATAFIIWRRIRSKVSKTLGIDENAGKEVEDELTIDEGALHEIEKKDNDSENEN